MYITEVSDTKMTVMGDVPLFQEGVNTFHNVKSCGFNNEMTFLASCQLI